MTKTKLSKRLMRSEAYYDDPARATEMWEDGFRPIPAEKLEQGMVVSYRATDLFQLGPVGPVMHARVHRVDVSTFDLNGHQYPDVVTVVHGGGETECDAGDEVWARAERNEEG